MKLCFLAGADSIHSKKWIEYFSEKGYEVHWISLTPNVFGDIKNVKLYVLKKFSGRGLDILCNINSVRRLIKKINPDIFHVHYAGVNGLLGALSGFHPFVLTAWGSDILIASKSKVIKPVIKFILSKADLITCNGEPLQREINKLGVDLQKIRFIYWATDIDQFKPGNKNTELRKELKIFDSPTIISLRNLEPVYDLEALINCIPSVIKEVPQAKFIIAGKGSQCLKLESLAKSLGVFNSIRFINWISPNEVVQYLVSSDIYVSTSLSDGDLSQCTQQAMACEIPIITTDIEVNKKRIKDGENGFLIPINNPKSLAEKIIILLKDEKLRIKFGKEGRKTIEDVLNYHKEMKKAENLYGEIANYKA